MKNFIKEIVKSVTQDDIADLKMQSIDLSSDIARLMVDIKREKISIDTMNFLSRMNLRYDDTLGSIEFPTGTSAD